MSVTLSTKAGSLERLKVRMWWHVARRLGAGQRQHLGDGCRRQRTFAWRAGLVAQKAVDAFFTVALLPAPHRRSADADTTRHFENRQPVSRQKHDAGALHVLQRPPTGNRNVMPQRAPQLSGPPAGLSAQ